MNIIPAGQMAQETDDQSASEYFRLNRSAQLNILSDASRMGAAGYLYSRIVADGLEQVLLRIKSNDPHTVRRNIINAFQYANRMVLENRSQNPFPATAGCAACVCLFRRNRYFFAATGQMSCYLVRNRVIQKIYFSRSKSWLVDENRPLILLGQDENAGIQVDFGQILENDCFIMVTDRMMESVTEDFVLQTVLESETIEDATRKLTQKASGNGKHHDHALVMVYIDSLSLSKVPGVLKKIGMYVPLRVVTFFFLIAVSLFLFFGGQNILSPGREMKPAGNKQPQKYNFRIKNPGAGNTQPSQDQSSIPKNRDTFMRPPKDPPAKPVSEIVMDLYRQGLDQLNPINNNILKADNYFRQMLDCYPDGYSIYIDRFDSAEVSLQTLNHGIVRELRGFMLVRDGRYTVFSGIYFDRKLAERDLETARKVYQRESVSVFPIREVLASF